MGQKLREEEVFNNPLDNRLAIRNLSLFGSSREEREHFKRGLTHFEKGTRHDIEEIEVGFDEKLSILGLEELIVVSSGLEFGAWGEIIMLDTEKKGTESGMEVRMAFRKENRIGKGKGERI